MLTPTQKTICHNTISATAFFHIVMDHLHAKMDLSVVRMADGERKLLEHCKTNAGDISLAPLVPFGGLTDLWLKRFGVAGIPLRSLYQRIISAGTECKYFAPSLSGITNREYDAYGIGGMMRERYVDNQFPNLWTEEQKEDLFTAAGRVLLIHGGLHLADAMTARAKKYHGVKVEYIPLTRWDQADSVIAKANAIAAPLTIFAAGPGSKFIGPRIKGVTLDIGQAMDRWTFLRQFEAEKKHAADIGRLGDFMASPYTFHG